MNYLFGTQFMSSAGRCTKGVYISIIPFKCCKTNKMKKLIVCDTEGIQSAEARDIQFDKRLVYYVICISNIVLLCNKGEMNAQMAEIVKLVADAIDNTKQAMMKNTSVYIILNMVAQTNNT